MTAPAQLLCSTRYQVIRTYDACYPRIEQVLNGLPKELLRIVQEYYGAIEGEADVPRSQQDIGAAIKWWWLRDDPLFQSIALSTDLFRFAIHGLEEGLPKNLGERFRFIAQRIPMLYPKNRCIAFGGKRFKKTTIPSPLDLPRIPPVTSSASFDPYHPERWGVSKENDCDRSLERVPFWQQRCTYYRVAATHAIDRDNHLPKGNPTALDEQILLGSIITPQGVVYCRLLFQDISSGGSVDNLNVDTCRPSSKTLHEFSWFPIARERVRSAPYSRKAIADFALCVSTGYSSTKGSGFDFIYRRVQEKPDKDITDADFLRDMDAKLPEDTTLADHYGTSRTNAPPSSATATAQRDASSAPPEIPEAMIQRGLDLLKTHTSKDTSKGNT